MLSLQRTFPRLDSHERSSPRPGGSQGRKSQPLPEPLEAHTPQWIRPALVSLSEDPTRPVERSAKAPHPNPTRTHTNGPRTLRQPPRAPAGDTDRGFGWRLLEETRQPLYPRRTACLRPTDIGRLQPECAPPLPVRRRASNTAGCRMHYHSAPHPLKTARTYAEGQEQIVAFAYGIASRWTADSTRQSPQSLQRGSKWDAALHQAKQMCQNF